MDLRDFADFQVCFGAEPTSVCLCTFDLDPPQSDGDIDLEDYSEAFTNALGGPGTCGAGQGTLNARNGGGSPLFELGEVRFSNGDVLADVDSEASLEDHTSEDASGWSYISGAAEIKLRAVGSATEDVELSPNSTYQVYYLGAEHPVSGYTLFVSSPSGDCPVHWAVPASDGEWADTRLFASGGVIQGGGVPQTDVGCDASGFAYQAVMDDMLLPSLGVGEGGHLCDILIAEPSELELRLVLFFADPTFRTTYESEVLRTYVVQPFGP